MSKTLRLVRVVKMGWWQKRTRRFQEGRRKGHAVFVLEVTGREPRQIMIYEGDTIDLASP